MYQQSLGVIAGEVWFPDPDRYAAHEPREQQGALDLGACHGTRVGEVAQLSPADRERQGVAALFLYMRPHRPQRLGDAPHRAAAERCVTAEPRPERAPPGGPPPGPRRRPPAP